MLLQASGAFRIFLYDCPPKHLPYAYPNFFFVDLAHRLLELRINQQRFVGSAFDTAQYLAMGHFYIHNVEEYNKAIAQNREAVMADIPKYTDIQPVILISEIIP